MPGLSKAAAEILVLDGLRSALMTEDAVAQFRSDYAHHLAEQNVSVRHRGLLLPRLPPFGEFKDLELMHVGVWH